MNRLIPALILSLAATQALAQTATQTVTQTATQNLNAPAGAATGIPGQDGGFDLMGQGADLIMRGIVDEMGPAIDQFGALAAEIGPAMDALTTDMGLALTELYRQIDNIRYYQTPEILANGDILIRRRPDAPPWQVAAP